MIIDQDQTSVVPLAELLGRAGAIPVAITGKPQLDPLVTSIHIADVAVCSIDAPAAAPPSDRDGVACLRLLREKYGSNIGLIATSAQDIESFKTILSPLDVVFVSKPASTEDISRSIKALL